MKMLVTGGAGFIGSNFVRHYLKHHPHDQIVNLDKLTYAGNKDNLKDIEDDRRHRWVHGDIGDATVVRDAMAGCGAVVHFAAATHVDRSITDPREFVQTNVVGTSVLLEAARKATVERFLYISTDEVYGSCPEGAFDEMDRLHPNSPYAASKAGGDLLAQAYYATHRLPVVIARPSNTFGAYQFPEKLLPLTITNALADESVPIYGDGMQRREWLFVEDHCAALDLLLTRGEPGEIYNIGSGWEQPNVEIIRLILHLLDRPESLMQHVQDRPGHDRRYALDAQKIRALGWQPSGTFAEALTQTVEWYRNHHTWWSRLKERLREDRYHWLNRDAGPGAA